MGFVPHEVMDCVFPAVSLNLSDGRAVISAVLLMGLAYRGGVTLMQPRQHCDGSLSFFFSRIICKNQKYKLPKCIIKKSSG